MYKPLDVTLIGLILKCDSQNLSESYDFQKLKKSAETQHCTLFLTKS